MSVAFKRQQILSRGDLDIFLTNSSGNIANAADISYALFFVDIGPPETMCLSAPRRESQRILLSVSITPPFRFPPLPPMGSTESDGR